MGHVHLATLPATKGWREVVDLLDERAATSDVVRASALAAERDLAAAAGDPGLVEAVRLLALIPQAARHPEFGAQLRALGIAVSDAPMLGDLTVAAAQALGNSIARSERRTDLGEIARRALVGTLSALIGEALPGLFEADASDVRRAAAHLRRPDAFARATRGFFGRLLADTLASKLDRTLSTRVGPEQRFGSLGDRDAFDRGLDQYCVEATRIIREFSGAWYAKTLFREGTITTERAAGFTAVAMKKIGAELQRKREDRA